MSITFSELISLPNFKCKVAQRSIKFPMSESFPCIETWGDISEFDSELEEKYVSHRRNLESLCLNVLDDPTQVDYNENENAFKQIIYDHLENDDRYSAYYESLKNLMTEIACRRLERNMLFQSYNTILIYLKNYELKKALWRKTKYGATNFYIGPGFEIPDYLKTPMDLAEHYNISNCKCNFSNSFDDYHFVLK